MTGTTAARAGRAQPGGQGAREGLLAGIPVTERRLSLAGIETSVLEGGDGPALLLLHGPGAYGASWQQVMPDLVATHHVLAPDLPGHGSSTVPDGAPDARRVMSWLGELIEQACPTPPVIVGQLVGGAMAARFAAEDGGRLAQLVLVVPFGLAPFRPAPAFAAALTGFLTGPDAGSHDELWRQCVHDLDALRRRPEARWELMKAYTLERARTPGTIDALNALVQEFGLAAIPEAVLARIDVPTTLIWGRNDAALPLEVGRRASERYGWPLEVIENAGNEPAIEQPDAFLRALRAAIGRGGRA